MLRMEIALILVLGFVAYIYYSAERTQTALVVFLFLSVYCNSGGGGDRKAAQAGLSGAHISGGCCRSAR